MMVILIIFPHHFQFVIELPVRGLDGSCWRCRELVEVHHFLSKLVADPYVNSMLVNQHSPAHGESP